MEPSTLHHEGDTLMRVSMRFAVIITLIAMGMTTLSLSTTGPAAAQGAKRYVIVGAGNSLPMNIEALVASVGGKVVYQLDEIGVAVVESSDPGFEYAAASISGIQGVVEDHAVPLDFPAQAEATIAESLDTESLGTEAGPIRVSNPASAKFFAAQWNLRALGVPAAWDVTKGDPRVKVAVIDTGIDYGHQELAGKVDPILSKSFCDDKLPSGAYPICHDTLPKGILPYMDMVGHGTHVAGIIAAEGISVAGIAPRVTLIAIKVAGRAGFADFGTIIAAIRYAADDPPLGAGADVINLSFGDYLAKQGRNNALLMAALNRAVNYAHGKGALLVASAGNYGIDWDRARNVSVCNDGSVVFNSVCATGIKVIDGVEQSFDNPMKLPAQLPHVVAVSGSGPQLVAGPLSGLIEFGYRLDAMGVETGKDGLLRVYTDHGMSIINLAAPGGSADTFTMPRHNPAQPTDGMPAHKILSACSRAFPGCGSGKAALFAYGTSMAAAHVSGVAALIDSMAGGTLTGDQIMNILMQSADSFGKPGKDGWYGFGRINAYRAVTGK